MTTLEGALVFKLTNDTAVNALVSGRIHPLSDPNSIPFPKIVYSRTTTRRGTDVGGLSNDGNSGAAVARIQFECLAGQLLDAKATAAAIKKVFHGFSGNVEGIQIGATYIEDERESSLPNYPGQEKPVQRVVVTVSALYQEGI